MSGDIYLLIRRAIIEGKQVLATYEKRPREMCPHVLGRKGHAARCLFYQFAGESSSGIFAQNDPRARQNWRCMDVDKLSDVRIRAGEWHSISRETRPQTCIDDIDVEVDGSS